MIRNKLQKLFIRFLTKGLFKIITEDDILSTQGEIKHRGRVLSDDEISIISEQARVMQKSLLWKMLDNEVRWQTLLEVLNKTPDQEKLKNSHIVLWVLKVINNKINEIANLR